MISGSLRQHINRTTARLAFAAALLVAWSPAMHAGPFLNAFIFGNLTSSAGDTEGNLLVGGNFTTSGSYGGIGVPVVGFPLPAGIVDTLIVGGNLTTSSPWGMNGNAVYGGTLTGGPTHFGVGETTRFQDPIQIDGNANAVTSGGTTIPDLAQLWRDTSITWSGISNTAGTSISYVGGVVLTGIDPTLNVFNVDAGYFNTAAFLAVYINVPQGSKVIINIPDTGVSVPVGAVYLNGDPDINPCALDKTLAICLQTQRVVFNFYKATGFSSAATGWNGSIIAPFTTSVTLNGGAVNGTAVFGGDVTQQGGWEFHSFPYTDPPNPNPPPPPPPPPPFSETPEPSTFVLAGLGLPAVVLWRKLRG